MPRLPGMELDATNLPAMLTPHEVAGLLRVDHSTVLRWIRDDSMAANRLPGGNYRIPRSEVEPLLKKATPAA
jgi:excisionase family DNA binding protein